mgnify:CR=1 FL=1
MAQTALTVQTAKKPFEAIIANGADFVFTAADVANGNSFVCTGKEVLLVYNIHATLPYTFGVTSVDDEKGRVEDITAYSLAALEFAVLGVGLTNAQGWKQSSGLVYLVAENASIKFAVLRLPAGYPGG